MKEFVVNTKIFGEVVFYLKRKLLIKFIQANCGGVAQIFILKGPIPLFIYLELAQH